MENKILLQDLAQGISNRSSIQKKDADGFVRNVFDIISQFLQEDKIVKIKGLGTFKVIEVSGRDSVNVNTGERIHISGHSKISFTPDTSLRNQVNRPFADFETIIINDGIDITEMERVPEEIEQDEPELDTDETSETQDVMSTDEVVQKDIQEEPKPIVDDPVNVSESSNLQSTEITEVQPEEMTDTESETGELHSEEIIEDTDNPVDVSEDLDTEANIDTQSDVAEIEKVEEDSVSEEPVSDESETPTEANEESSVCVSVANIKSENEEVNGDSSDALPVDGQQTEKERVVYVDNSYLRFSRICFALLTLALMALSYLAGYQRWFIKDNSQDAEPRKEQTVEQKKENTSKADEKNSSTISSDSARTANQQTAVTPDAGAKNDESSANSAPEILPTKVVVPHNDGKYPDGKYQIVGTKCTHVIKSGQGLYQLARIYYGNMNMATYIIKYNNITNPDVVSEGSVLKIPELKKMD